MSETVVGGEDYDPVDEPHPAGTKVGRYVILERVGQGGMGVVYAAFDPELNRRVALKILHATRRGKNGRTTTAARTRLMREAQAMARVSHPNVISVFDVGTLGDSVFVAMEFVDGPTLTRWLQQERRAVPEIAAMFAQAGRGLAAAHEAGLVHRDFKPDNVLIGSDGHARVLDFGLARTDPALSPSLSDPETHDVRDTTARPDDVRASAELSDVLSSPLTQDGAVVGTPRYMAPEQHAGVAADGRSDQFGFCVALYGALFRQEAYSAPTLERLALAKQKGDVRRPPGDSRVSPHLEAAVLRGLAPDPNDRWPDMRALVSAIVHDPAAARRRAVRFFAGAGLAAAMTGGVVHFVGRREDPCVDAEEHLAGVWDETRRTELGAAMRAVPVPYAAQTWEHVEAALDEYASTWASNRVEACTATHVRREQSEALLDRRMRCLDQRKLALQSLVAVLAEPDASVVQRATQAVHALPRLDACSNADYLLATIEPPPPEQAAEVQDVRERVAEARALQTAGRLQESGVRSQDARDRARTIDYPPLQAEAQLRLGSVQETLGQYELAQATLLDAMSMALRVGHDEIAASAAHELAGVVGDRLGRYDEGLRWATVARSLYERLGLGEMVFASLDTTRGNVLYRKGELELARESYEGAVATIERAYGPDDARLATQLVNLGNVLLGQRERTAALTTFERAGTLAAAEFGARHPITGVAAVGMSNVLVELKRYDDAETHLNDALSIFREAMGEDHPFVVTVQCNFGVLHEGRGELAAALAEFERCRDRERDTLGEEHPEYARVLFNIARVQTNLGRFIEARAGFEAALALRKKTLSANHDDIVQCIVELAEVSRRTDDLGDAVQRFDEAIAMLERADGDEILLARARFGWARASWAKDGPNARARGLAEQARATLATDGEPSAEDLREVEAWQASIR